MYLQVRSEFRGGSDAKDKLMKYFEMRNLTRDKTKSIISDQVK